ncbi:MAG: hypothetical protein ACK2T7_06945 [Anaerolineales bacterium]
MNAGMHDTIDRIARFLEREETRLPERVTNHMILIALREERDARRREMGGVEKKLDALIRLISGPAGSSEEGLAAQVARLERFRKAALWVLSAISLAFLGGLGSWLLGIFIN